MKRFILLASFILVIAFAIAEIAPFPGNVGEIPGTIEPAFSNQYAIAFDGTTEHMTVGTEVPYLSRLRCGWRRWIGLESFFDPRCIPHGPGWARS